MATHDNDAGLSVTILGSGPAAPNAGGACSGYLLHHGDAVVALECGSGIVGQLKLHAHASHLQAVVISHLHADHYFDLIPLYYELRFGAERRATPLPLYVPPGGKEHMRRFGDVVTNDPAMLDDQFDVREYELGTEQAIGDFMFTFHLVQHYIPSHAMRVRPRGQVGPLFVFSGDVAPCPALVDAARGADLFMCESAIWRPDQDYPEPARRGHMMASEAGAAAATAGAKRLLITHYRTNGGELEAMHLANATATFGGPVELAEPGHSYPVGARGPVEPAGASGQTTLG